jgi:hypothetical protein
MLGYDDKFQTKKMLSMKARDCLQEENIASTMDETGFHDYDLVEF